MYYNFVPDSFHTKKLDSRLLSCEVRFRLGLLESAYSFFARCYGWGATSEYRFEIGSKSAIAPTGAGWS